MATSKKATGTTKKAADAAVEEAGLKKLERSGYEIIDEGNGNKSFIFHYRGLMIPKDSVVVYSTEEACALTGIPFRPSGAYDFSENTKAEFEERHSSIFDSFINIDNAALKVAFCLHWINAKQAFLIKNFPTIVDYAKFYFGYEKTSCYSLIGIVDRFAKRDEDGNILEEIDPAYSAYSSSKLSLMVNLTDEQITKSLKPAMSVRDIKKIVKALEASSLPDHSKDSGTKKDDTGDETKPPEQSGTDTGKDIIIDSTAKGIRRNTLFTYKGAKDYVKKFNAQKVNIQLATILEDHPDALIEISYTLP